MITIINGAGVKFSRLAKCPSTKIQVRMPSVDPSVSALITAALIGSTTDPNARNISSIVVLSSTTAISGALSDKLWMLSCSSAGTPPTRTVSPLGWRYRPQFGELLRGVARVRQTVLDHPDRIVLGVAAIRSRDAGVAPDRRAGPLLPVGVGESVDRGGVVTDLRDLLIGDLAVVVALDHQRQLVRPVAGELLVEILLCQAHRVVRRKIRLADPAAK